MQFSDNPVAHACLPLLEDGGAPPGTRRVGIVTTELLGFHRNGGIGTCYSHLAEALAANGHDVHVLLVQVNPGDRHENEAAVAKYGAMGIRVHLLSFPQNPVSYHSFPHPHRQAAHEVQKLLSALAAQAPFDLVHVSDGYGLALDCLRIKHLRLAFQHTLFLVGLHSPALWIEEANGSMCLNAATLNRDVAERSSAALADILWSPSHYLLDWIRRHNWEIPSRAFVMPYLGMKLEASQTPDPKTISATHSAVEGKTLIFFGRLEPRKGLYVFLDALEKLCAFKWDRPLPRVVFLGKSVTLPNGDGRGRESAEYIAQRMARLPCEVEIADSLDHAEALTLLRAPGSLAVIPSLVDNSPNTVYECLLLGIPFLASRSGGIPELIHPEDVEAATFPHHDPGQPSATAADHLAGKLELVLRASHFAAPIRPSFDFTGLRSQWIDWHARLPLAAKAGERVGLVLEQPDPARVAVCMATAGCRTSLLARAVDSLRSQSCRGFHFVLVNDGGNHPDFLAWCEAQAADFKARGWKIVHQENQYVGKARNRAQREASREFALFMDDDNLARPHEVETFLRAQSATNADILTCGLRYLDEQGNPLLLDNGDEAVHVPVGPDPALALMDNCLGDLNFFVRSGAFDELGGFPEDRGLPFTDWIFLARACLRGKLIEVVPDILFDYTVTGDGISRAGDADNSSRILLCQEYAALLPAHLRRLPHILHFVMREMGGGTIGDPVALARKMDFTLNWANATIDYYKSRSTWFEDSSTWFEERCKWFEERALWLEEHTQRLEERTSQMREQIDLLKAKRDDLKRKLLQNKS